MKTHKTLKYFLLLLIIGFSVTGSFAQKARDFKMDIFKSYFKKITAHQCHIANERIFLHLDNTAYSIGDKIWFAAYLMNASNGKPSEDSGVLYVELINGIGQIVVREKLKVEEGFTQGNLDLSNITNAGFYEVRAYTRWSLNNFRANYFSRVVPIFTSNLKNKFPTLNLTLLKERRKQKELLEEGRFDVKFFPESGNLIYNINSRIAFQVIDRRGIPVDSTLLLYNKNGKFLSELHPEFNGMGTLRFSSELINAYVKVKNAQNDIKHYFPPVKEQGIMFEAKEKKDSILLSFSKNQNTTGAAYALSVTCRGVPCYYHAFYFHQNNKQIKIAKSKFKTGVNCITLFNLKGKIVAERLFWMNHDEDKIRFNASLIEHGVSSTKIHFKLSDYKKKGIKTHYSVSVHALKDSSRYRANMLADLLMASELKGYIHRPYSYFIKNDSLHRSYINLLLMTQGWRRHEFQEMLYPTPFNKYQEEPLEKWLLINGFVMDYDNNSVPFAKIHLDIFDESKKEDILSIDRQADSVGYFSVEIPDYYGLRDVQYLLYDKEGKKKRYHVWLNTNFYIPKPQTLVLDSVYDFTKKIYEQKYSEKPNQGVSDTSQISTDEYLAQYIKSDTASIILRGAEVTAKKRFDWTQYNGGEKTGWKFAYIKYDTRTAFDQMESLGFRYPTLGDWMKIAMEDYFYKEEKGTDYLTPRFDGRKIVTLFNNENPQLLITRKKSDNINLNSSSQNLPKREFSSGLENVHSIMLSKDTTVYIRYFQTDLLRNLFYKIKHLFINEKNQQPYTMFIYADPFDHSFPRGTYGAHYEGFTEKEVYTNSWIFNANADQLKNTHRTIYWNAKVESDEKGKSIIDIDCKEGTLQDIVINVKGFSKKGLFLDKALFMRIKY